MTIFVFSVSTASTDSSTSGCGASLTPSEEDSSVGSSSPAGEPSTTTAAANGVECVECITGKIFWFLNNNFFW